jgi:hypothetical protein
MYCTGAMWHVVLVLLVLAQEYRYKYRLHVYSVCSYPGILLVLVCIQVLEYSEYNTLYPYRGRASRVECREDGTAHELSENTMRKSQVSGKLVHMRRTPYSFF